MVGEEEGLGERGASQKMETDFQLQRWMCHTFDWESLVLRLGDPIHRGVKKQRRMWEEGTRWSQDQGRKKTG